MVAASKLSHGARAGLWLLMSCIPSVQLMSTATAASAASPSTLALAPCELPGLARAARCGVLEVPENPRRPDGRRLAIHVAVVPATSGSARPDPLVPLGGGPGEDTISGAGEFAARLEALHRERDLLLVDQRGTGRSGALYCDLHADVDAATSLRDLFPPAAAQRCAQQLSVRADLTQYTYVHFANDLEQVRRALGYGKLNLFAGSYGTRAAQVYLREHPQSVRTAYLGSVVPIDVPTPLTMAKTAQAALDDLFSTCAADAACHSAFPNLRDEFRQLVARLDAGAVRGSIRGQSGTVPLQRGRIAEWFRAMLYRPDSAASLPWLIHQAYLGEVSPIAEGILAQARGLHAALSLGLFFAITCNDDIAFVREDEVARATQGTFLGDYRLRQQQAACQHWPKVSPPPGYRAPVRSSVPTLFVSGDRDGASPLWFTAHSAPGFAARVEIVARGQGHTEWNDCVARLYEQFVRSGQAHGLDPSSCEPVPRPAFRTR